MIGRHDYEEQAAAAGWHVGTGVWEYLHAHPEAVEELIALPDSRHETLRPLAERTRCRIHELAMQWRHWQRTGELFKTTRMKVQEDIERHQRTLARMRGEA